MSAAVDLERLARRTSLFEGLSNVILKGIWERVNGENGHRKIGLTISDIQPAQSAKDNYFEWRVGSHYGVECVFVFDHNQRYPF